MLHIKKVLSLPAVLLPNTIYLHADGTDGLVMTVTGTTGEVIRHTKSSEEIFNIVKDYTDAEITKVVGMIPTVWESVLYDHNETWGADIYIQQTSSDKWRIKKIDSNGIVSFSTSTDGSNVGVDKAAAWAGRTTLTYI